MMYPLLATRRRGRVIGRGGQDDQDIQMGGTDEADSEPAVKRPSLKSKKKSSSRLSFGPGGASASEESSSSEVFTPKKSNLSRQAIETNALKRSGLSSSMFCEPPQERQMESRPSYSKDYLTELKNSTPSAPQDQDSSEDANGNHSLDVAAKFGADLSRYQDQDRNAAIPTEVEIQEKKARRARLAKEQKYKSKNSGSSGSEDENEPVDHGLDSEEDEFRNQRDTVPFSNGSKYPETRLTQDDEDIMEDFDSFVDDGRIKLGRKAEKEHRKRQRDEMRDLIAEAEDPSSEDSDDSEKQRRDDYDSVQTRKGMEGLRVRDSKGPHDSGVRTPPKITPLPSLSSCVERLRAALQEVEASRKETMRRLTELESKRQEIPAQEEDIQQRLKEAGEQYERLRKEAGLNGVTGNGPVSPVSDSRRASSRGMDTFGEVQDGVANA